MTKPDTPVVSVIVPARNEEACLGVCLESLTTQAGTPFEVIVVDDGSTDRTSEIARSFAERVRVSVDARRTSHLHSVTIVGAPPLPKNWTGKNNAMAAGAKIAKGKWLLFTDADTVHGSGSLVRAVAEADDHGVALLSYSPRQEVHTLLEKAVMPVIFAELAATYPPAKVRDPNSPIAAANGQYLMISREAYDAVGGHSKIASDLLEDVAMAKLVKSSGRKIWFRYGGDAVRTRMYRNWSQMKQGWTKNLALLFANPAELGQLRIWQFVVLLLLPPSILRGAYSREFLDASKSDLLRWSAFALGTVACGVFIWWAVSYVLRMRRSHSGWSGMVFGFLGLPVFGYLLLRSHRAYKTGRFDWKDRSYVYDADEVENLKQAPSPENKSQLWRKALRWIRERA